MAPIKAVKFGRPQNGLAKSEDGVYYQASGRQCPGRVERLLGVAAESDGQCGGGDELC
jgi:hypothetical protein